MTVAIYHNPDCGTSRSALAIIQGRGLVPEIIEYLKTPPSREHLAHLIERMGVPARGILRQKGALYEELHLDDSTLTEDALINAMIEHPVLMNRPIVVTPLGVRLCRPAEMVLKILPD